MSVIARVLASGLGIGYVPIGGGTVASLAVVGGLYLQRAAAWPGIQVLPFSSAGVAWLVLLGLVGVWAASAVEAQLGKDSPQVVIDEVVGMLITLWGIPLTDGSLVVGLLLFRWLDIAKPGPIRRFEKLPGGWGVMMDDVAAGLAANIVLRIWVIVS